MLLLSISEFRANVSKYLAMAMTEKIAIRSKSGIFNITPNTEIRTNPSPSNDPWFDVPENMASVERGMQWLEDYHNGKEQAITLDELKNKLKNEL